MKTKPFDLELAELGHPLVSVRGEKVIWVGRAETRGPHHSVVVKKDGTIVALNSKGLSLNNTNTVVLDVSKPWEAPLKTGDIIEVKSTLTESKWSERIYLAMANDIPICVNVNCVGAYKKNQHFEVSTWRVFRRKPEEPVIEITVKVNGKEAKLSDISKETLLQIRENN
jgi:hypothetical protein